MTFDEERLARLLSQRIVDAADYEAARYLIDKGYAEGSYQISKRVERYGQVRSAVLFGPTAAGVDFSEALRAKAENPQLEHQQKSYKDADGAEKRLAQDAPKSSWITIAEGVAVLVLTAMVLYLIADHFGISLPLP